MIRPHDDVATTGGGLLGRIKRRQLLRLGFLGGTLLAVTELTALLYPFLKPNKIVGLGAKIRLEPSGVSQKNCGMRSRVTIG